MERDNSRRPDRHRPCPTGSSAQCAAEKTGGGPYVAESVVRGRVPAEARAGADTCAGAAVLRVEHVRRYLGRVIHDATRSDLASRIALHQAVPVFTRDLVELAEDRTVRIDRLDAAAHAVSHYARSRDATLAERGALRDAWAGLLEDAVGDRTARERAWRQIESWRLSDALTLLSAIIPARYAFADGAVTASDIADHLDALARERNQTRLRDVAATLRGVPMPLHEVGRETLFEALGPVFGVDLEHRPSVLALRACIATWSLSGSVACLGDVLSAALLAHIGAGQSGVSALGKALTRRHDQARRLQRADTVLMALAPLRPLSVHAAAGHADLFRIVYALHDALRDADGVHATRIDTIWRQCEIWRSAALLPLLPVALSHRDFFIAGRLRLADIDAHLKREYRLMRAIGPDLRVGVYPDAYRDGVVDEALADDAPWLAAFARQGDETRGAVRRPDVASRTAESQFRLLEIILLRETTEPIARLHLSRGLLALRHSRVPAMCNLAYSLQWYETVLVDPVVAPFNSQIVLIVDDMIETGTDLTPSPVDWIGLLSISPDTLGRLWQQRACFTLLTDRYYTGWMGARSLAGPGPVLGIDSFAMFSARLGDRRARALSRWTALARQRLLTEEPPDVLVRWVDLLLDDTISDAAMDSWLSGLPADAFVGQTPSVADAWSTMRRFEAAHRFRQEH
ncbi:hypothetical protein [Robbsia sp. KACC 23696]|uniref:hypothetical protein n=1 Tax=Robbsia sp. KACC 23696 TaxID=3149231 RepID=UPI00325AE4B9